MESLATQLRLARESRHVSLKTIAHETRISLHHLENLEQGRFQDLPGGMYNRAFIRTYCEHLGIDPRDVLERYEAETAQPKEKAVRSKTEIPEVGSALKPHPLFFWSVMLLISVAGLYLSRRWIADAFSPFFTHPSAPGTMADSAAAPPPAPKPKASVPSSPVPIVSKPASEVVSQAPPTLPAAAPQPTAAPVAPGTIRLEFEVLQECWVSVDRDGNRALSRVFEPGDDQAVSAREKLFLIVGNAGGIRLKINGRSVRPLGKPGEVVRLLIDEQSIKNLIENTSG